MEGSIIDETKTLHRNMIFLQKAVYVKFTEFVSTHLPNDMSGMEHRLLMFVGDHEGCLSVDVANAIYLKKSTISGMVNSLVEKGFLRIEHSGEDKRKLPIFLTEKGKERVLFSKKEFKEFDSQLEKGLPEEDLESLYRIYRKIELNLEEVR